MTSPLRWLRIEAGWYTTVVEGRRVDIVNAAGYGPRAPRWQGETAIWIVRLGGTPWTRRSRDPFTLGQKEIHSAESYTAARAWVAENTAAIAAWT